MGSVLVIGGGASGLVASIYASLNNKVILIDKNNNLGKKILMTGNGKCNYWNKDISIKHYNSSDIELVNKIITNENKLEIENFFKRLGIVPKIRDSYYYPASNQATSIQTALVLEAKLSGVEILNNEEVLSVDEYNDKYKVITSNREIVVDKIVLATGSKACPKTGSTGFGYEIAKKFGHTIVEPLPALVQLKLDGKYFKEWAGIRSDVSVKLYENDKFIKETCGEIQLTDYGVSGICIFQLSSLVSRGLYNSYKEEIEINFLNSLNIYNEDNFIKYIDDRNILVKNRNIQELLDGILNYKLINLFLKISKIDRDMKWEDISKDKKLLLGRLLTKNRLLVNDTNGFDSAQVCSGGVKLSEINPNTMESLKQKDLYIVGELLDVDGECGGFNLGFAWISGYLAGKSISDIK